MWSVHLIYRNCPQFGNGFFYRFSWCKLEKDSLIGFPWSVHLTTGTVHSLEMASLIGYPWSVHWFGFPWSVNWIYRNCPKFGNGFFERFSLICALWPDFLFLCTWSTGTVQSLEMDSLIGDHVICALDLQELSTIWKWLLWSVFLMQVGNGGFDRLSLMCTWPQELPTVWKWRHWSVFLDLCTGSTRTVHSLKMVSLIGFPLSVHWIYRNCPYQLRSLEMASLICFNFNSKWIPWSVFLHEIMDSFGNGFLDRFSRSWSGEWPGNYGRFDSVLNTFWREV
jgi:hypothetical protein